MSGQGGDTDLGVDLVASRTEAGLTSHLVSVGVPPHPDPVLAARGLPDYAAMLEAELVPFEGEEPPRHAAQPSSLGTGELVLTARELSGLTQRQLAALAGTSQAAVTGIETGNRLPSLRSMIRLLDAAGFDLVVGLRRPGSPEPIAWGAVRLADDGLADYLPLQTVSPFVGPGGRDSDPGL